jgi:hypothetical protein
MVDMVCLCGATEEDRGACLGGPCRFVDADAVRALNEWIMAAESIRGTCGNLEEFDALIAAQKRRRDDLF